MENNLFEQMKQEVLKQAIDRSETITNEDLDGIWFELKYGYGLDYTFDNNLSEVVGWILDAGR